MCKLNKYTDIYPGNRVVHHSEHELCSRSRNGKPCDRAQEFRYPTEHIDSERLSPRATYDQPPTPPRSSRSPSTSDSERPRRRSESYHVNGARVDVNHKPPSPRRERAEHVAFVEATSVPRNATRRYDAPSSRRPPSPYEEDFEVYETSYREREPASDMKSNVSTTSSTSTQHSTTSKHSNSSKHSISSSTTSKDSKESKSGKKNYSGDERDERDARDSSPQPAARPVKKVLIAEDPAHKSHRRQGSKTRDYDSEDEDNSSSKDKVRYYTPGEEVQSRINRHNEEIANRPAAPVSAPAPKSSAPVKSSAPPKSSSKAVSKPPVTSPSSNRTKYRRGSVQVDDTLALTAKLDDIIISRQQAAEKERRRQERDERALQARLKERLGRSAYSPEYSADTTRALTAPRHRNEPSVYRY